LLLTRAFIPCFTAANIQGFYPLQWAYCLHQPANREEGKCACLKSKQDRQYPGWHRAESDVYRPSNLIEHRGVGRRNRQAVSLDKSDLFFQHLLQSKSTCHPRQIFLVVRVKRETIFILDIQ
jgi:hypothetical protein